MSVRVGFRRRCSARGGHRRTNLVNANAGGTFVSATIGTMLPYFILPLSFVAVRPPPAAFAICLVLAFARAPTFHSLSHVWHWFASDLGWTVWA